MLCSSPNVSKMSFIRVLFAPYAFSNESCSGSIQVLCESCERVREQGKREYELELENTCKIRN